MNSKEIFAAYVVYLRVLSIVHQNNHWTDSGNNFYAHHLLFDRIYKETAEFLDEAAEKAVGIFGSEALTLARQSKLMSELLNKYSCEPDGTLQSSLAAEKDFCALAKRVYDKLKESGTLSLGLDDLIMNHCNGSEGHQYLLQQAIV